MCFERRRKSVKPVDASHEIGQRSRRLGRIDTQRYNGDVLADRVLDFAANLP
jgi:hypothetical protein